MSTDLELSSLPGPLPHRERERQAIEAHLVDWDFEPGDRIPGEPTRAYKGFVTYRDLSPMHRRLRAVANALECSYSLVAEWSTTWAWQRRVADYDQWLARKATEESLESQRQMLLRQRQTALLLQTRAVERLETMTPDEIKNAAELVAMLKAGVQMERESYGLPGELVGLQANPETPVASGDIELLPTGALARKILENDRATSKALDLLDELAPEGEQ